MLVILSLVPMVSEPPPPPPEPPSSSLLPPPQAVRASAVIAMPAVAANARRPPLETDLIRYLVFMGAGRGRTHAPPRPPVADWRSMPSTRVSAAAGLRTGCYAVVTAPPERICGRADIGQADRRGPDTRSPPARRRRREPLGSARDDQARRPSAADERR